MNSHSKILRDDRPVESRLFDGFLSQSAGNFFFEAALVLYVIAKCIDSSYLGDIAIFCLLDTACKLTALCLLAIKTLILTNYRIREGVLFAAVFLFAALAYLASGSTSLLFLAVFVVGAKGIDSRRCCKHILVVLVVVVAAVVLMSLAGFIQNRMFYGTNNLTGQIVMRRTFGFSHQNNLGHFSLMIFLCWVYCRKGRLTLGDDFLWCIAAGLLFFVVSTKTAALLIAAGVVLCLLYSVTGARTIFASCTVIALASVFIGIYFPYVYDSGNALHLQINSLLSGRLYYAHGFINAYPITMFGQNLTLVSTIEAAETGQSALVLDNAYIHVLLRYGVASLLGLLALYAFAYVQACRKRDVGGALAVTMLLLIGLSETWLFGLCGIIVLAMTVGNATAECVARSNALGDFQDGVPDRGNNLSGSMPQPA